MEVERTYVSISGFRVSSTINPRDGYHVGPHTVIKYPHDGPYAILAIDELDDLLVALHTAKDDLKFLLAKQEHEKTADAQSEEKKK